MTCIRIKHRTSGMLLAEGKSGWDITPFEGNYYVRQKCITTDRLRLNWFPGFCPYKFFYFWMDLDVAPGERIRNLAWLYWLPNPLLPFIWFRPAFPGNHPDIEITRR